MKGLPPWFSPALNPDGTYNHYVAESWYGLYAPANTPPDIVDRLNKSAAKAVQAEALRKLSVNEGLVMVASPPAELDRYFTAEEARWRKVIRDAGIKAE